MKTQTAWAIVSGAIILPFSIRSTRAGCITNAKIDLFGKNYSWETAKYDGYRCVKIKMEEVIKES